MSLPVVYRVVAQDDVDAAYNWYEQQRAGLGDRFLDALHQRANSIGANPELYAVLYLDVRAAPLRRFPYVVYYRIETDRVVVIAVRHGRRPSRPR